MDEAGPEHNSIIVQYFAHGAIQLILIILFSILALSGCPEDIEPPAIILPAKTSGAMLLSHGNYLYVLGGILKDGTVSAKTYVASIDQATEGDLKWTETTAMPSGRAHGAAIAVGNMLYVIGGSEGTRPVPTIYYTAISSSDGTLGFGTTARFWETNPNPLPFGLSHMSQVLHDGRVFLIGGMKEDGASDSIIHARIWQKGMIGMWYEGTQKLPSARFRTAAALRFDDADPQSPYLTVAGGIDDTGKVLDETIAFSIGRYGKLEAATHVAPTPKALDSPILVPDVSALLIGGGYDSRAEPSSAAYRYDPLSGSWSEISDIVPAQGPSFGSGNRSIWYLTQEHGESGGIISWKPEGYRPSVPIIGPGSGTVQYNTAITYKSEAGSTVLFSQEEGIWSEISSLGKITADQVIAFKASSLEGDAESSATVRDYHVHSLGFLVHVSGNITLMDSDDDARTINLTDDINDKDATGSNSVRVMFQLYEPIDIVIRWIDTSSSEPGSFTALVSLSLFEEDLLAEVIDNTGNPILDLSGAAAQPVEATLQRGTYYFTFEDVQGESGRSFGLSVCARE